MDSSDQTFASGFLASDISRWATGICYAVGTDTLNTSQLTALGRYGRCRPRPTADRRGERPGLARYKANREDEERALVEERWESPG
jgi:hypothetical protein